MIRHTQNRPVGLSSSANASVYSQPPSIAQDPGRISPPDIPSPAPDPERNVSLTSKQSPPEPTARPYKMHAPHRPPAQAPDKAQTDRHPRHTPRGYKLESHRPPLEP